MRMLLLIVCFPVVLLAQNRRSATVDSIKAAANDLQSVSAIIGSSVSTKMEPVVVKDSGGFVTLTVRIRVDEMVATPLLIHSPITKFKAVPVNSTKLNLLKLPPLPPVIVGLDTISALLVNAVHVFNTVGTPFAVSQLSTLPPFPDIVTDPEPVPLRACIMVAIARTLPGKMDTMPVPVFEEERMPVEEMHLSDEGYLLLEKLEGFSPELYTLKDGGFTIGYGFFVPYSEGRNWKKGVTKEEAELLIREKMPAYEDQVKKYINVPLTQEEFDALTMMAYNLGGFSKATSIVNDVNSDAGFDKLQQDWMRFVHSKAPGVMKGLMNRRRDELKVRNERDYQPERKIQIFKNRR